MKGEEFMNNDINVGTGQREREKTRNRRSHRDGGMRVGGGRGGRARGSVFFIFINIFFPSLIKKTKMKMLFGKKHKRERERDAAKPVFLGSEQQQRSFIIVYVES